MIKAILLTVAMTTGILTDQATTVMDALTNLNYPTLEELEAIVDQKNIENGA